MALVVIIINLVLAAGGFLVTIIMTILGFMVKRLIKAVDDLRLSNEKIILAINERPDYLEAEKMAERVAAARVLIHENDHKHEKRSA